MRIYEVVSNQNITNEQILTEIDWKKLRNALIGGAMSLAVLGSPGQAIEKALDAKKITADQAIELIQKKVMSGEINPNELQFLKKLEVPSPPKYTQADKEAESERLKKIVKPGTVKPKFTQKDPYDYYRLGPRYKIDDLPFTVDDYGSITSGPLAGLGLGSPLHPLERHFNNTRDQWSQPQYSRNASPNAAYMQWRLENDKVDTKSTPTVKQDEPKKAEPTVKKDEPVKVQPTVKQDQPKKTEPVVKKDEPVKAEPTVKKDEPAKTDTVAYSKLSDFTFKGLKFGMSSEDVKPIMDKNFTIFDIKGWVSEFKDGELSKVRLPYEFQDSELSSKIWDFKTQVEQKFGKSTQVKPLEEIGYYQWIVKDAVISLKVPVTDKITGKINKIGMGANIEWQKHADQRNAQYDADRKKASKDF